MQITEKQIADCAVIWLAFAKTKLSPVDSTQLSQPWLSNYPQGVPTKIDADKYATLIDMVEESCKKFATKKAFTLMGKSLTFKEIDQLATQFGAYLQSRGLETGDRFAIMAPNLLVLVWLVP